MDVPLVRIYLKKKMKNTRTSRFKLAPEFSRMMDPSQQGSIYSFISYLYAVPRCFVSHIINSFIFSLSTSFLVIIIILCSQCCNVCNYYTTRLFGRYVFLGIATLISLGYWSGSSGKRALHLKGIILPRFSNLTSIPANPALLLELLTKWFSVAI